MHIREVDGGHSLGAAELAEQLIKRGWALTPAKELPLPDAEGWWWEWREFEWFAVLVLRSIREDLRIPPYKPHCVVKPGRWVPCPPPLSPPAATVEQEDGNLELHRSFESGTVAELLKYQEELQAKLERLEAEVQQLGSDYAAETDEFNAGYEHAQNGGAYEDEYQFETPHDVWGCGFAWASFEKLRAKLDAYKRLADAVAKYKREWRRDAAWPEVEARLAACEGGTR